MTDEPERPSEWHIAYSAWLPDALRYGAITTNDAFRAGYLAASSENGGWLPIRDAPDICPRNGGIVGRWYRGQWYIAALEEGMWIGNWASNKYTHYRLNPGPPLKPGSDR